MVDQEMLAAISDVIEEKLQPIRRDIEMLKADVSELKADVSELKADVSELKADVSELKADVSELKADVSELKADVSELKVDNKSLHARMDSLEKEVRRNSVILENEVLPRLQTIEQCYVESSRIFMQKAEQIDKMQDDIDVMKLVIQEHSRKLEMIS